LSWLVATTICLARRRFALPVDDLPCPSTICLARHGELSGPASHPALKDELWTGPRPARFHIPLMCLGPRHHEYFAWTFTSLEILRCATDSFAHAKAAYQEIASGSPLALSERPGKQVSTLATRSDGRNAIGINKMEPARVPDSSLTTGPSAGGA